MTLAVLCSLEKVANAEWFGQVVDDGVNAGRSASLALTSTSACVSYYDLTTGTLRYASWDGANWTRQTIDSVGTVWGSTSLAMDASGYPHISYAWHNDGTGAGGLKYASWTGAAWSIQTLAGSAESSPSLALDSSGSPHIAFADATGQLKYASLAGGAWSYATVAASASDGPSLALDTSGNARISYVSADGGYLGYAAQVGSSWRRQIVDAADNIGYSSLALDSTGQPRIAYCDGRGFIKYAAQSGGAFWSVAMIDNNGLMGASAAALALDSSDVPQISYFNSSGLMHTAWSDQPWDIQPVAAMSMALLGDASASLRLDATGKQWICYYSPGMTQLLLSHDPPILPGDANRDGKVSFADYIILANNFGQYGDWPQGDFNADGKVSFADYILLANNFGQKVPEPGVLAVMAMGATLVALRRRRVERRRQS